MSDTQTDQKTQVDWVRIDIHFKYDIDLDALAAAAEPTPELRAAGLPPAFAGHPDDLNHRLMHWGWTCADGYGRFRRDHVPRILGYYWDWTWLEDDMILLPRLAPFIERDSTAFFTVDRYRDDYEGWAFDGTTATRRKAEKIVEYEFTT